MRRSYCLALLLLLTLLAPAWGHYHMLLPETASARKGDKVRLTFQFGHPFEHQLFNADKPARLLVLAPDGKKTDLLSSLEPIDLPAGEGKKVKAFQLTFTPEQRGDYVFLAQTEPVWMEEDAEFLLDTVKVVLHVQAQKGWDELVNQSSSIPEWMPLTRPYGLLPGMVFQARLVQTGSIPGAPPGSPGTPGQPRAYPGFAGKPVEVERYHAAAPKVLPPDELITRTVKTDPNGVATTTLTDPGWWSLTGLLDGGERERGGKKYPVRQRSTLWVYVQDKPAK